MEAVMKNGYMHYNKEFVHIRVIIWKVWRNRVEAVMKNLISKWK